MKLHAEPGCAALFEPPALEQALLDVQAAVALARAQVGLQSWASAREVEAACRIDPPVAQDLLDMALLLQLRRALNLFEADVFASADALLVVPWLPRPLVAGGLGLLLGGIEPLRRALAAQPLRFDGDAVVAALLARNFGVSLPQAPGERQAGPQALPALLIEAHAATGELRRSLDGGPARLRLSMARPAQTAEAERLIAHWRHRLPHLRREAFSHGDPRLPAD